MSTRNSQGDRTHRGPDSTPAPQRSKDQTKEKPTTPGGDPLDGSGEDNQAQKPAKRRDA